MLFRSLFITVFVFIFLSCSEKKADPAKTEAPEPPAKTLTSELDTFYAGNNLICISDTSKAVFQSFTGKIKADTNELNQLNANKELVKRSGDTLIFTLGGGKTKKIISTHYTEGTDEFYDYKYLGRLKSVNYHLIFVQMYEAFSYLLINAQSGKETTLCGLPTVSPNKKYLAASSFDLQAGFVFNSIEMFDIAVDSLTPVWSRELSKWGADNLVWINDHELVAEQMQLDSTQNAVASYIKIVCCGTK